MVWIRRVLTVLLAFVLSAGAFLAVDYAEWSKTERVRTDFDAEHLFDPCGVYEEHDGSMEEGMWTVTGGDPWIAIPVYETAMDRIRVRFAEPVEDAFSLQIYYCRDGEGPAEDRSVIRTVPEGCTEIDFTVPDDVYDTLRMDINGDVTIESVDCGYETRSELSYEPDVRPMIPWMILTGVVLAALMILTLEKGKMKRFLAALCAAILIAGAVEICVWIFDPANLRYEINGEETILDLNGGACFGCEYEDGALTPTENDPQWHFANWGRTVTGVVIRLSEPAVENLPVRVYYRNDERGLSDVNSLKGTVARGTEALGLNIEPGDYDLLRFDFEKETPVMEITVSGEPVITSRTPFQPETLRAGILLGVALILLYMTMGENAFRRGIRTLCRKVLNPETRYPAVGWIYAGMMAFLTLYHIYVTLYFPTLPNGAETLRWVWIGTAFTGILLGRMWKDKGFWILTILLLLKILRVWIPQPQNMTDAENTLLIGIFTFFTCYSTGKALGKKQTKTFLAVVCAVWMGFVVLLCCCGIYSAWTGIDVINLADQKIQIKLSQLHLIYHSSTAAGILSGSVGLGLILLFMTRSRILKALDLFAVAIIIVTNGLTVARTSFITIGFAISLLICVLIYNRIGNNRNERYRGLKQTGRIAALGVFGAALMIGLTLAQTYLPDAFMALRDQGGLLSHASAEGVATAKPATIAHRSFFNFSSIDALLSGRWEIWGNVIRAIRENPTLLLWGRSVCQTMQPVNLSIAGYDFEHCHNIWLETLLENGIPGIALLIAFQAYFLCHAVRLIKNKTLPMWERLIPFTTIVILIGELVECLTLLKNGFPPLTFFYLFAGFTVAVSNRSGLPDGRGADSADNRTQDPCPRPDADPDTDPGR